MKIVVLEGSPNQNGSSNLLAGAFIRGAQEAGHTAEVIDAAHAQIHPCTGCIHCGYEGPCVQKDDMEIIRTQILDADRPLLRLQQQHPEPAHEVGHPRRRLEQRQLDL